MVARAFSVWRHCRFNHKLTAFLSVGLLAVSFGAANGETEKADQTRLNAFLQSNMMHELVNEAVQDVPPAVLRKCPGLVSNGSTMTVLEPMSFDSDGAPETGAWRVQVPVSGCGNDTTLNFFFSAKPGKNIHRTVALPGDTRADPALQRDAVMYAVVGANLVVKDCDDLEITNTKFDGFGLSKQPTSDRGADERSRPWRETWTLAGCGHRVDVPMQFAPDATGTQIIQPGGVIKQR
jgi:hypothetical protein